MCICKGNINKRALPKLTRKEIFFAFSRIESAKNKIIKIKNNN